MEILTKSLLNISESIGIPRNPLLAINPNISNLTYNTLPINSYPSFPPAPQNKVVRWATLFCGAEGRSIPLSTQVQRIGASEATSETAVLEGRQANGVIAFTE